MRLPETERLLAHSSPAGLLYATSGFQDQARGGMRHRWLPFAHVRLLNDVVLRAATGELAAQGKTGALISTPPRHGKSELMSKGTPAWYLGRFPQRKVILGGYQAEFAARWGRKARDLLWEWGPEVFGVKVSESSSARDLWEIAGAEGAMRTAGVGGAITGFGADLLLVDDPTKNAQDAASEVMRENLWEWWLSTARTRLHAGGSAIVTATRWHEDDLIGRLIAAAAADPDADQWEVINLPAIAEPEEVEIDGELQLLMQDVLGRSDGEPLCRELGYDEDWARKTRASVGSYVWHALYQGKPRPADGLLFKKHDFQYFSVKEPDEHWPLGAYLLEDADGLHPIDPRSCVHFMTADTADSEKKMADYSVVSTWAVTPGDRKLLLVDVRRAQFERERATTMLEGAYTSFKPRAVTLRVENAGPSGPKVIKALLNKGLPIASDNPDTDKVTRALVAVALYEAHRVYHRRGVAWLKDWEDELLAFPNSTNDDQVDTASYAAIALPRLAVTAVASKSDEETKTEMGGVMEQAF